MIGEPIMQGISCSKTELREMHCLFDSSKHGRSSRNKKPYPGLRMHLIITTTSFRLTGFTPLPLPRLPRIGRYGQNCYATSDLSLAARWQLAAAYQLAGKPQRSKALVLSASTYIKPYKELWFTLWLRHTRQSHDHPNTLSCLNLKTRAAPLVKEISSDLASDDWISTQTTAYCLLAISRFIGSASARLRCHHLFRASMEVLLPLS